MLACRSSLLVLVRLREASQEMVTPVESEPSSEEARPGIAWYTASPTFVRSSVAGAAEE
jgi:hypothetical protein